VSEEDPSWSIVEMSPSIAIFADGHVEVDGQPVDDDTAAEVRAAFRFAIGPSIADLVGIDE